MKTVNITRDGLPDMRVGGGRHNTAYITFQQLLDFANKAFREALNKKETGEYESLVGQNTNRPDMRLAPNRHDVQDVAMQEILGRIKNAWRQESINQGHVPGVKMPLPSLEKLFEHPFLPQDLAEIAAKEVPNYIKLYEYSLSKFKQAAETSQEEMPEPPPSAVRAASGQRRKPTKAA